VSDLHGRRRIEAVQAPQFAIIALREGHSPRLSSFALRCYASGPKGFQPVSQTMCGFNRNRLTAGLIVAAIESAAEAAPPNFSGHRTAARAPEVMIYFSHSIGGGTGARSTFEIRAQQVSQIGNSADPRATGDTMRHDPWLSWKADTRADLHISAMQLKLGSRLTYDLTQARFASSAHVEDMQLVFHAIETRQPDPGAGVCNSAHWSGNNWPATWVGSSGYASYGTPDTKARLNGSQSQAGRDYLPAVQDAIDNFDFGAATPPLKDGGTFWTNLQAGHASTDIHLP